MDAFEKDVLLIGELAGVGARRAPRTGHWFPLLGEWIYIVGDGETMWSIAQAVYGRADKWRDVWRAQRAAYRDARDPSSLVAGDMLAMPRDAIERAKAQGMLQSLGTIARRSPMIGAGGASESDPSDGWLDVDPAGPRASSGGLLPPSDATCDWTPTIEGNISDEATPTGLANAISYHNRPVAWAPDKVYQTTIAGVRWAFVMYSANGLRMVSTFKCVPRAPAPGPPPSLKVSSSAVWWVLGAVAVVGAGAGATYYFTR